MTMWMPKPYDVNTMVLATFVRVLRWPSQRKLQRTAVHPQNGIRVHGYFGGKQRLKQKLRVLESTKQRRTRFVDLIRTPSATCEVASSEFGRITACNPVVAMACKKIPFATESRHGPKDRIAFPDRKACRSRETPFPTLLYLAFVKCRSLCGSSRPLMNLLLLPGITRAPHAEGSLIHYFTDKEG